MMFCRLSFLIIVGDCESSMKACMWQCCRPVTIRTARISYLPNEIQLLQFRIVPLRGFHPMSDLDQALERARVAWLEQMSQFAYPGSTHINLPIPPQLPDRYIENCRMVSS